ncbi:hypothetical protein GCM10009663_57240 [Kitasatospora arboriphila]|uniref:Cell division protein ZipA n=1 Tax=Kitasatospora arboriphila TaxID=258052 RepID=A0ABP4ELL0_9ACTN
MGIINEVIAGLILAGILGLFNWSRARWLRRGALRRIRARLDGRRRAATEQGTKGDTNGPRGQC